MLDGTFPIENIALLERMYSIGYRKYYPVVQGYRPVLTNSEGLSKDTRTGSYGLHWIKTMSELELPPDAPGFVAAPDFPEEYRAPQRIYSAIYNNDFLINYAIAKDHREAGITGAMKNNYGCTDNPLGTHGHEWTAQDSPYPGSRLCAPVFYKHINQQAPYILNILDALTGIYHGGPLSGKVFHANTFAVSRDPVALDSYSLNLINRVRMTEGISTISTEHGWTPEGHPYASFLCIASENHGLGSMSLNNLQLHNLSSIDEITEIPILQNSQSRISEVSRTKKVYQVQVFLDQSGRTHTIESRIEDIKGNEIRAFKSQSTLSSSALLQWDHRNNKKKSAKEGIYTWYINVDGVLHSGTINDYSS